ncbi:hypothetical protein 015DV004_236 [Bacillus phage 015DV004]|nr:hypothetical protein 015DV004_236 [Bacillus phage 015DV004]
MFSPVKRYKVVEIGEVRIKRNTEEEVRRHLKQKDLMFLFNYGTQFSDHIKEFHPEIYRDLGVK